MVNNYSTQSFNAMKYNKLYNFYFFIHFLFKKSFTASIDNDYYLHVFKGRSFMLTSGKHDIAHIASSVYFSQP